VKSVIFDSPLRAPFFYSPYARPFCLSSELGEDDRIAVEGDVKSPTSPTSPTAPLLSGMEITYFTYLTYRTSRDAAVGGQDRSGLA
jgi:hypothetical protein